VPRIVEACNDPLTRHWLARLPSPYTTDDARAHLEHLSEEAAAGRSLTWAVTDPQDDRLLGEVALFGLVDLGRSCEVGYWTHPAERGRGAMTSAVRLATRHALLPVDVGGLGRARVVLRAADGNGASQQVAVRAGFVETGRDRQAEILGDGSVDDLVRFDLLAEELTP
jgi:RimJ/RimL family protein N-acetyltransferase